MRSIESEFVDVVKHSEWTSAVNSPGVKERPSPVFKDCTNCPVRSVPEAARRKTCFDSCIMVGKPDSPSLYFMFVEELSNYPDDVIDVDDLQILRDVAVFRRLSELHAARVGSMMSFVSGIVATIPR